MKSFEFIRLIGALRRRLPENQIGPRAILQCLERSAFVSVCLPPALKRDEPAGASSLRLKILKGTWPRKGAVKVLPKVLGKVLNVTMCYRLSQIG